LIFILYAMTSRELFYALALLQVEGVGDIIAKKLIQHFGSAEAVFQAKPKEFRSIDGVGEQLLKNLNDTAVFTLAEEEVAFVEKKAIGYCSYLDSTYPERLKHCIDGPLILFYSGNVQAPSQRIISIVGTRKMTAYGAEMCRRIIEEIAPLKPTIVSGYAYGVDICAHQLAMEFELPTIGVLAHGLNQIYPKTHHRFMHKMEENGGFMTEFWSSSKPDRENFVRRNRIVAGMSEATIVIESAEKGGSLITASLANDYSRDVFAVPGRSTDKYSMGCNHLIKTQRAHLLTSGADLVYMLNWDIQPKEQKSVQKQLFITLEPEEQKIYDYLVPKGKELMDIIALECDFPIFKISSLLLNMELKGVVRPLPGKYFEAI
jgi:DNA processing protein